MCGTVVHYEQRVRPSGPALLTGYGANNVILAAKEMQPTDTSVEYTGSFVSFTFTVPSDAISTSSSTTPLTWAIGPRWQGLTDRARHIIQCNLIPHFLSKTANTFFLLLSVIPEVELIVFGASQFGETG